MKLNALKGLGINLKIEDLFDEEGFSLADVNDTLVGEQAWHAVQSRSSVSGTSRLGMRSDSVPAEHNIFQQVLNRIENNLAFLMVTPPPH